MRFIIEVAYFWLRKCNACHIAVFCVHHSHKISRILRSRLRSKCVYTRWSRPIQIDN